MTSKIIIYGIAQCPFCKKAREDYGDKAIFYDIQTFGTKFRELLQLPSGARNVPVIIEDNMIKVGYGGTTDISCC